jgi:TolB protein
VTRANVASTAVRSGVILVDVASGAERTWTAGDASLPLSAPVYLGDGREIVVAQSESAMGNLTAAQSRVMGLDTRSGRERLFFWAADLFPAGGNSFVSPVLDAIGPGQIVFDSVEERQKLVEVAGASGSSGERALTRGRSVDRQPAYSPDGEQLVFSSNRTGNLDLSVLSTKTGAIRQITDDPADDWDPAFTPDGRQIVWSSGRGGSLEIWIANVDGSGARQVTKGGKGAENPTMTRDGWIVYTNDDPDPEAIGIWRIRADGTAARRLLAGPHSNPEVSPDGRYALAVRFNRVALRNQIRVVEIESGNVVPFEIEIGYRLSAPNIVLGRARWMPDGRAIAFVGMDAQGRSGVFVQDFTPGRDTAATRRPLAGFSSAYVTESFGIAPDGRRLTLSTLEQSGSLMIAEGLPGVAPARRKGP